MSALSWVLQMYLSTESPSWVDIHSDALAKAPIVCEYGIDGNLPTDRVAATGTLKFTLDNSEANSAGLIGYYSPLNTSKRSGYDFNVKVRFLLSDGVHTQYKFVGKLRDATPAITEDQEVACTAVDWMDAAASIDMPDSVGVQFDRRLDEIAQNIINAMDADDRPDATDFEVGNSSFPIALDQSRTGARPKIREVLIDGCLSEYGAAYIKGDGVQGGTLKIENRTHRAANPTVYLTLLASDFDLNDGLIVPGSRDDIFSRVHVFVRPTRVDTTATTVLFSLQSAQIYIGPGETNDSIFGPYRDPSTNDQIGGFDEVAPVAGTDYAANSAADGTGSDLTANLTVSASTTGIGVKFSITNNGAVGAYVVDNTGAVKLQIRGKAIRRYDALIDVEIGSGYGTRPFEYAAPWQTDVNVATDLADFFAQVLSNPLARVRSVRFLASDDATLLQHAIQREPGDRFAIAETESGINNQFTINKVRLEVNEHGHLWCTWFPEPAGSITFWLWGIEGSSNWGESTRYGF
jgi:hypothetical protein